MSIFSRFNSLISLFLYPANLAPLTNFIPLAIDNEILTEEKLPGLDLLLLENFH